MEGRDLTGTSTVFPLSRITRISEGQWGHEGQWEHAGQVDWTIKRRCAKYNNSRRNMPHHVTTPCFIQTKISLQREGKRRTVSDEQGGGGSFPTHQKVIFIHHSLIGPHDRYGARHARGRAHGPTPPCECHRCCSRGRGPPGQRRCTSAGASAGRGGWRGVHHHLRTAAAGSRRAPCDHASPCTRGYTS